MARTCALRPCTFGAAPRHIEPKTSGTILNVVAMVHSALASTCALRPCASGAAARHIESKTSGTTLNVVERGHSELASSCAMRPSTIGAAARQIEFGPDSARHDHGPLRIGPSHCSGRPTRLESPRGWRPQHRPSQAAKTSEARGLGAERGSRVLQLHRYLGYAKAEM